MTSNAVQPKDTNTPASVLQLTERGIYCAAGDFFIDPRPTADKPAVRSIITHGQTSFSRNRPYRSID